MAPLLGLAKSIFSFYVSLLFNRHTGDLGNIEADSQGQSEVNITDNVVTLMGEHSVIGRTLAVRINFLSFHGLWTYSH